MQGREKREIPEKTHRHVATYGIRPRRESNPVRLGVSLLASHQGEPGSIPGGVTPGFSPVGIVPDDAAGRLIFSGISRFPRPFIPALLHTHLASPSSALKTSTSAAEKRNRSKRHVKTVHIERETTAIGTRSKQSVNDASAGHLVWWQHEAVGGVVQLFLAVKHACGGGRVPASDWLSRMGHSLSSSCDELDACNINKERQRAVHFGYPGSRFPSVDFYQLNSSVEACYGAANLSKFSEIAGRRYWGRIGKEAAMVFVRDPYQHSPGMISEKPWKTEIRMAGTGIEPGSSRMRLQHLRQAYVPVVPKVKHGKGHRDETYSRRRERGMPGERNRRTTSDMFPTCEKPEPGSFPGI
ncbi:hypothetical protein PR048_021422 [Dryococelus australis]|uniref:Uncharacterized protein n=1 Tax=Dryococelus australis TaxID=614101 RepID=A0ABQ9GY79_9NEOP|nr:hypothetical protein PR048_021422 [Dryococelus australis]